jgi:ADP-ribose pyrophosphatase YjhB (NUDIX family)
LTNRYAVTMTQSDQGAVATPRVAAGALFTDQAGRMLLVKPAYKAGWDIPGGYVMPGESPLAACRRELGEELGGSWPVNPQPLVVDWAPADGEGDKILFVFAASGLEPVDVPGVAFPDAEITDARFITASELDQYVPDRLARRLRTALCAYEQRASVYAEHGLAV